MEDIIKYPFYIIKLRGYKFITSKGNINIPHHQLWSNHVSKIFANHYKVDHPLVKDLHEAFIRGIITQPQKEERHYSPRQIKILKRKGINPNQKRIYICNFNNESIQKLIERHLNGYDIIIDDQFACNQNHVNQINDIIK